MLGFSRNKPNAIGSEEAPAKVQDVGDFFELDGLRIPTRFVQKVRTHFIAFGARHHNHELPAPQILLIVGPPGSGKTRMAVASLKSFGVPVRPVSASALGGEHEGDSMVPLREAYINVSKEADGRPSAVLIDDFDLSGGQGDKRLTGTVNAALLNSFMMHLADNPFELTFRKKGENTTFHPVPCPPMIMMTANDPRKIFGPLMRPGRAQILEWTPTPEELIIMVSGVYPALSSNDIEELVTTFPGQPVGFFKQMGINSLSALLMEEYPPQVFRSADDLDFAQAAKTIKASAAHQHIETLIAVGREMLTEVAGANTSYLPDTGC